MRSKPVKFSCCSTNFWVLNGPVAGQRAALTAHAGSRHHQVHHVAPLCDHTGDARACTPSSGGQIESGFHARSVRTVSEPSPTSLPTLLTRPMLHHRRQSHRPTLCRPRWRHPHSHLRLASPTRTTTLFLMYCQGTRILHFRRAASGCCASVTPTGAARCKVIMCIPPMLDRRARLSTSPPCAETRQDQIIYYLFLCPSPATASGFDQGASMPLPPPSHHPCHSAPMTVHCP